MNWAHIHLMLNHIPVLGAFATLALMLLATFKKEVALKTLTFQFVILIGVLAIPTYLTGEEGEETLDQVIEISEAYIEPHEDMALNALIATEIMAVLGILGLFLMKKKSKNLKWLWIAMGSVGLINAVLMAQTAKYGGEIRHTEFRINGGASETDEMESEGEYEDDEFEGNPALESSEPPASEVLPKEIPD